ncbi:glycoside hydrolase family 51 protein [Parathielavia appendiculata]|uniref:Glycoside hydrolase family 51 protein n=1 Tax=Parathielavia appendiculata TaxID=2587402 RepID=A0AAN6Z0F8_9PEZI|nr:glycoside hydrolase family 51 protein [Parathielavia appendiculata]
MMPLSLRALALLGLAGATAAVTLSVANTGGNATSPYMYGIMFEDINQSGDGGLYAELIRNRAFQNGTLDSWSAVGGATLTLDTSTPLSQALPRSVKVTGGKGTVGLKNPGYSGIDVKQTNKYSGSFYSYGAYGGSFTVSLYQVQSVAHAWTQHKYELRPIKSAANSNNSFVLEFHSGKKTEFKFNLISLFPPTLIRERSPLTLRDTFRYQTYKNRPNGMRRDLMEKLADLKPSFLRIPGGNNIEGDFFPNVWNWTATVGPLTDRRGRLGTWTYYNTDGLGLVEYMHWAEDHLWGGLDSYKSYRLRLFYDVIKAKYPDIFIFSSTAEYMYKESGRDYHLYTRPDYFVSQFDQFDRWSAGMPIIIGEYGTIQNNTLTGKVEDADWNATKNQWSNWIGSVAEAVYLLGAERNGDRIWGTTFAPLFQNLNSYQWASDLIAFTADPADTTPSVSYPIIKPGAKAKLTVLSADSPWAHNTPQNKDVVITTVNNEVIP